jgi:type IV pilus assembly protein PilQ
VIDLELSALEAEGKAKIVSSPRLVTADQMEAVIEDGQEIPYTTISDGGTNVQFKKATLSLKVTPQITPDGNVMMDLKVNKDSPGETVSGGLAINTKQITTKVLVENGGTVVIGGIYVQTQSNAVTKIPLLGDIPFIGHLFRQTTKEDEKRELLIFVTPRILRPEMSVR